MSHAISWFEIPTKDIDRAQQFYETILATQLINMDNAALKMRAFPIENFATDVSGALVYHETFYEPAGTKGCTIYLNANPDVQAVLDRIENAGGSILVPKTMISPQHGFMALFMDTEGNRVALHSIP